MWFLLCCRILGEKELTLSFSLSLLFQGLVGWCVTSRPERAGASFGGMLISWGLSSFCDVQVLVVCWSLEDCQVFVMLKFWWCVDLLRTVKFLWCWSFGGVLISWGLSSFWWCWSFGGVLISWGLSSFCDVEVLVVCWYLEDCQVFMMFSDSTDFCSKMW